MRKAAFVTACLLIFHTVVWFDVLYAVDLREQKSDLPRRFLPKTESSLNIRKEGNSISILANKSTLEEILERIAAESRITLKFYCQDPSLNQERAARLKISAASLEIALRQLLSEAYLFKPLSREGKPIEDGGDIAAIHIYPKRCAETDLPMRVFIAEREHPSLRKLPEETSIEELRDAIKTGGPAVRRRGVVLLGMKADEEGIAPVKEALMDENPQVMFAAVNALNRLGQKYGAEKVADAIYGRFREKPYAELLPIMAEVDRNRIWPMIDALLDLSGEREKGFIARALFLTNDPKAIRYLLRIASTGGMEISKQAIYGIGKIGGPEAATVLLGLLREGDNWRQVCAAQAVFFLPKEDALEVRAEVERIVKEERVSDVLLEALARISYLEPFETVLRDPASKPEQKIRALKALTTKGSENTVNVISLGLNDKVPMVRLASVEAMGSLAVEPAIPYLIKATQDTDAKVRRGAIRGLSEFPGNENVVEVLGKLVDDPDESVRRESVDALELMGEPNEVMMAILLNCKNHKDPYVADKANSIWQYWGL